MAQTREEQLRLIRECHEGTGEFGPVPGSGAGPRHRGRDKTQLALSRTYYWPGCVTPCGVSVVALLGPLASIIGCVTQLRCESRAANLKPLSVVVWISVLTVVGLWQKLTLVCLDRKSKIGSFVLSNEFYLVEMQRFFAEYVRMWWSSFKAVSCVRASNTESPLSR